MKSDRAKFYKHKCVTSQSIEIIQLLQMLSPTIVALQIRTYDLMYSIWWILGLPLFDFKPYESEAPLDQILSHVFSVKIVLLLAKEKLNI